MCGSRLLDALHRGFLFSLQHTVCLSLSADDSSRRVMGPVVDWTFESFSAPLFAL